MENKKWKGEETKEIEKVYYLMKESIDVSFPENPKTNLTAFSFFILPWKSLHREKDRGKEIFPQVNGVL